MLHLLSLVSKAYSKGKIVNNSFPDSKLLEIKILEVREELKQTLYFLLKIKIIKEYIIKGIQKKKALIFL